MDGLDLRLEAAISAARQAAQAVRAREGDIHVASKGRNDLVSDLDLLSETTIREALLSRFPADAFLGEEGGRVGPEDAEGLWVVDPIDGSADLIRGIPLWTISIGYMRGGQVVLGVVHCPGTGEMFHAARGRGAFRDGRRIHVSNTARMEDALTAVTPPIRHMELASTHFPLAEELFGLTSDFREFGSAALHLCYVAAGRLDGFFEFHLKLHDICAGVIMVEEAGGAVADADEGRSVLETGNIIASNAALASSYVALVRKWWARR